MDLHEQARERIGEHFIIGFEGKTLSDDTAAFLSQAKIGGVILFAHNYESPEQLAKLSNQVQECRTDLPLWVSVDQEGGRVQRFKDGFTLLPSAKALAEEGSPKTIYEVSEVCAKELCAVGINLNFAPVADINTNPANPVIGDRAFGSDEATVSKLASGVIRGHLTSGVQACAKHFPGHGETSVDSHLELPRVDTKIDVLKNREFRPFLKCFKSRCAMVMSAHILNPNIDPDYPATLSRKTLTDLLRGELRYSRIIISDDMEMEAITKNYGAEEAPLLALKAGCDMLIYRSESAGRHAYKSIVNALEEEKISPSQLIESAHRSTTLKEEFLLPYEPTNIGNVKSVVGIPEHLAIVEKIKNS